MFLCFTTLLQDTSKLQQYNSGSRNSSDRDRHNINHALNTSRVAIQRNFCISKKIVYHIMYCKCYNLHITATYCQVPVSCWFQDWRRHALLVNINVWGHWLASAVIVISVILVLTCTLLHLTNEEAEYSVTCYSLVPVVSSARERRIRGYSVLCRPVTRILLRGW